MKSVHNQSPIQTEQDPQTAVGETDGNRCFNRYPKSWSASKISIGTTVTLLSWFSTTSSLIAILIFIHSKHQSSQSWRSPWIKTSSRFLRPIPRRKMRMASIWRRRSTRDFRTAPASTSQRRSCPLPPGASPTPRPHPLPRACRPRRRRCSATTATLVFVQNASRKSWSWRRGRTAAMHSIAYRRFGEKELKESCSKTDYSMRQERVIEKARRTHGRKERRTDGQILL